jgi:alpha-ribazole phosphatase
MALIDLVRHGETEQGGLLLGRTDGALSQAGWLQFERQTANRTWSSVVSSPLRRSREPAEKLARRLNVPMRIDSDWAEVDFGDWDGRPLAELRADPAIAAQLDALYRSPDAAAAPRGESWQALLGRVADALDRLSDAPASETALVVTHGGPIRAALALACAIPFEQLWTFKIGYGTRVRLRVEKENERRRWGEIIEIVQP